MKLKELLRGVDVVASNVDMQTWVDMVVCDSGKVTPGSVFVAIAGFSSDGNRYISAALEKGAVAIVTMTEPDESVPYVLVRADRLALAQVSCNFYGHPARSMKMIGVTGTNGKTSVTFLVKHVLETVLGVRVGLVGTVSNMIADKVIPTERTTPDSLELQALFARMRDAGCSYVVMEVSSHAIALERIGGFGFDVVAFTNLTEDHLDFHKTMENYCDTKARLFTRSKKAVANRDDIWFSRVCAGASCPVLTTSIQSPASLQGENIQLLSDGVHFTAVFGVDRAPVSLAIPGKFTVYNALTVLGIALQLGIDLYDAADALKTASGIKGRVEVVPTPGKPYTILIDYAHTPDGLENVLSTVRGFCRGRLIAVFGCGGDRDPLKRPVMGRIGSELTDIVIITSDNPRTEEPMAIIKDILKGINLEKNNIKVIENRPSAIRYAMDIGEKNDIIVLAGKGNETYQEIRGAKYHMDEREIVADHLTETRK